jgi:hypothetical protein
MTADWWQWVVSIWKFATPGSLAATKIHPLRTVVGTPPGTPDPSSVDCMVGQHGDVWFLGGSVLQVNLTSAAIAGSSSLQSLSPSQVGAPPVPDIVRTCTIPLGTDILMPVLNGECNTAEEIHLKNLTGDETLEDTISYLKSCAKTLGDAIQTVSASFGRVGQPQKGLNVRRVSTPRHFSMTYPPDHIFEQDEPWKPAVNPSLAFADGYWVLVKPLKPGQYKLNTYGNVPSIPFSLRIKYLLTIVGPENQ